MVKTKYSYIIVEGQHDIEVVGKILSFSGINRVTRLEKVDSFWTKLIPKEFPQDGDLIKRVQVPAFFQDEQKNFSIAVHEAVGEARILDLLDLTIANLDLLDDVTGLAIIIDADKQKAQQKYENLVSRLKRLDNTQPIAWAEASGLIKKSSINAGIYIFPDNNSEGTLEDVLLKCGESSYKEILDEAKNFMLNISEPNILNKYNDELDCFKNEAKRKKAVLSCVSNMFNPASAIQVSIRHNKWICEKNKEEIVEISSLFDFINNLIGLNQILEL